MASLPYPRRPLNNSPTDGTDQHRWFGCVGFSHGIHGIHRSFWRRIFSHGFHRFHRWLGCVGFSHGIHGTHRSFWWRRASHRCTQMVRLRRVPHGIHGIHRSFWRRRASHGIHRCPQMVRLRRLLWEDSLVSAWVWQDAIPT